MNTLSTTDKRALFKKSMSLKLSPNLFRRNSIIQEIEQECEVVENGLKKLGLVKKKNCVIAPNNTAKAFWDSFILILIIYSVTYQPYNTAFPSFSQKDFWLLFDSVIDFIFMIDIILLLLTGFYDKTGTLNSNYKIIFIKYLKTWLLFDLVINFPYQLLQYKLNSHYFQYLTFLKALRVHKFSAKFHQSFELVNKFLQISHISETLIMWLIILCLFLHVTACLWVTIGNNEFNYTTWLIFYKIQDESNELKYLSSLYWVSTTIFTVGFGEIIPVTTSEQIFAILTMGIGVFFFSYIISTVSLSLKLQSKRNYHLESNLRNLQMINKKYKLPKGLYNRIQNHIKYNLENTRKDHKIFALGLSNRLSQQLIFIMHKKVVDDNLFFQDKPEAFIKTVVLYLMPIKVDYNEVVFNVGDLASEIFFIVSGGVEYYSELGTIDTVDTGDYFGDAEIFQKDFREFNVRALGKSEFLVLEHLVLVRCMNQFENVKSTVITIAIEKCELLKKKEEKLVLKKNMFEDVQSIELKNYPSKVDVIESE